MTETDPLSGSVTEETICEGEKERRKNRKRERKKEGKKEKREIELTLTSEVERIRLRA